MKKNFIIPDELKGTFDRLMNLVPDRLKNDAKTQKTICVYLKLGGEKLAWQCVQLIKSNLPVTTHDKTSGPTEIEKRNVIDPDSPDVNDFEFSDK